MGGMACHPGASRHQASGRWHLHGRKHPGSKEGSRGRSVVMVVTGIRQYDASDVQVVCI